MGRPADRTAGTATAGPVRWPPEEPRVERRTGHGQPRLDDRRREELAVEVLGAALGWVTAGSPGETGVGRTTGEVSVLGRPAVERELRFALEQSYRVLARLADRAENRIDMVERANRARPRTWV
ncbi:tetratricopeptide repeat protein [Kitasatospora sp. NPDC001574]